LTAAFRNDPSAASGDSDKRQKDPHFAVCSPAARHDALDTCTGPNPADTHGEARFLCLWQADTTK
jgi:hypothetical protein